MREQDVGKFAAGAAAQRLQNGLVLTHGFAPSFAFTGKVGRVAYAPDAPGEVGVGRS